MPIPFDRRRHRLGLTLVAAFYAGAVAGVLLPCLATAKGEAWVGWLLASITAVLYGVLSLLLLQSRPGDVRARLFTFLGLVVSLSMLFDAIDMQVGAGPLMNALLFGYLCTYLLTPAIGLHVASHIPRPSRLLARWPRALSLLYAACLALAALFYVALLNTAYGFLPWPMDFGVVAGLLGTVNRATFAAFGLAVLAVLYDAARHETTERGRRQALIVFAGMCRGR
ncbi:MAG TPA: hypothetical protein VFQ45_08625 [Longimicrobium sp.]|nr:hypothetical protein [Longimicrobium sp.]